MAVWGRAIAVVALLGALAACEYAEEGDPRPSAPPGSSSAGQPDSFPVESTPDPGKEKRAQKAIDQISASLGKVSTATRTKSLGGIAPIDADPGSPFGGLAASSRLEAGRYRFRTTCAGDREAFLIVIHEGSPIAPRTIRCGEVDETVYTLAGGTVNIRLKGITPGIESVGGVHVLKLPAKP